MKTSSQKLIPFKSIVTRRETPEGMKGLVVKVTPLKHLSGNSKSLVTVAWDNGFVGVLADQSVAVVK